MSKQCYSLYVFFWVFPRRPIVVCRRFGTLYQFHSIVRSGGSGYPLASGVGGQGDSAPHYNMVAAVGWTETILLYKRMSKIPHFETTDVEMA